MWYQQKCCVGQRYTIVFGHANVKELKLKTERDREYEQEKEAARDMKDRSDRRSLRHAKGHLGQKCSIACPLR